MLKACDAIRDKLFRAAVTANDGALAGRLPDQLTLRDGKAMAPDGAQESLEDLFKHAGVNAIEEYAEFVPPGVDAGRRSSNSMPARSP